MDHTPNRYGCTVAELMVPTATGADFHLNAKMTRDGYAQYSRNFPQKQEIARRKG